MFTHFDEIEEFMTTRKTFGIKPGLERMNRLLHLLDHPEKRFKSIHVAGTNGKGSTIEFMKKVMIANGYHVGVFTSPSLHGLTGHIWSDDQKVDGREWLDAMNDMYPIIQQLDNEGNHPTSFEIITAISFVYFSENVDIALIETGMGGRYDTTNCIQPILSIITNVSKDHTFFLGKNVEEIAYHKAGIIKKDIPVILGDVSEDILPVFRKEAIRKNASIYQLHHHFTYREVKVTSQGQQFIWECDKKDFYVAMLMKGIHQINNVSLALMAILLLKEHGFRISWQEVLKGIHHTVLSGRFEKIQEHPTIIVDGAHNPAGANSFIETVQTAYPNEEKHLIFAAYKDKDVQTMLDILGDYFQTITLTTFCDDRAASIDQLYHMTLPPDKRILSNWKEAVLQASGDTSFEGVYFITGSLAFISIVRSYILNN